MLIWAMKKTQLQFQAGANPRVSKDLPKHHWGEQDAQSTTRAELAKVWPLTSGGGYIAGSPEEAK